MHLKYDKQLEFKTDLLHAGLKVFPPEGFEQCDIRPIIECRNLLYYLKTAISKQGNSRPGEGGTPYAQNSHYLVELKRLFGSKSIDSNVTQRSSGFIDPLSDSDADELKNWVSEP